MSAKPHTSQKPSCVVAPIPHIGGERRTYQGLTQPFAAHAHRHYVIGRVEEGERELELNGRRLRIGPGDLVALNPGDVHGCRHVSDRLFAYDSVTIAAEVLDGASLRFPAGAPAKARQAYDGLLRSIEEGGGAETLERARYLASCLDAKEGSRATASAHEGSVLRVSAHMRGHLAEPHAIAGLAAMEGISAYALIRAYRRRFSITPLQHLVSLRVERACELLSEGATTADVAAKTGFSDQAHLTRAFRQRVGTTPGAYKRMAAQGGPQK